MFVKKICLEIPVNRKIRIFINARAKLFRFFEFPSQERRLSTAFTSSDSLASPADLTKLTQLLTCPNDRTVTFAHRTATFVLLT